MDAYICTYCRSEWDDYWRTATDPIIPNINTYTDLVQSVTTTDPYNAYKITTNNYYSEYYKTSTTQSPYYQSSTSTTKGPYDDFYRNWYLAGYAGFKQKFSQKNDYGAYTKKPAKSSLEEFYNLFYGRTTTQQTDVNTSLKNNQIGEYTRKIQLLYDFSVFFCCGTFFFFSMRVPHVSISSFLSSFSLKKFRPALYFTRY